MLMNPQKIYGLLLLSLLMSCAQKKPMNVVLFYIDDLGWTDLGCYGSDLYETPNIDQLAKEGVKFTDAYAACTVCSPSRAAVMTGKYPARLHLTDWIPGHVLPQARLRVPDWQMYLDTAEVTLAERMKMAGYATAIFGKWHLGDSFLYWPEHQGFDLNVGGYRYGSPGSYFYPYHGNRRDKKPPPNLASGQKGEYLTYRLTEEAVRFIRQKANEPFFIYFSHYAVHRPLQAPDSLIRYFKNKVKPGMRQQNATYAAMVKTVDQSVGRIRAELQRLGIADQTAIIFTSDNGGLELANVTDNGPIRAGKGSAYEGGVRVPFIGLVPGITQAGRISHLPVIGMDLYPTIQALAGLELVKNDGENLLPYLQNPNLTVGRKALYWHYPHYHPGGATPYSAVRMGDYKLIEFFEDGHTELYNLANDIGEEDDLSSRQQAKTAELHALLKTWRRQVDAQLPSVNPDYQYNSIKP